MQSEWGRVTIAYDIVKYAESTHHQIEIVTGFVVHD